MRNNLFISAVLVFLFWWIVLSFGWLFGDKTEEWTIALWMRSVSITWMSAIWGMAISSGLFITSRFFHKAQLVGTSNKGITVSLGPFPKSRKDIPRMKRVAKWHPLMENWVRNYGERYPDHLSLLEAVAEVLEAHPLHPASIEPGGHGDRTLHDHSHYVAEFMLKGAPDFNYKGVKGGANGNGTGMEQLDALYRFNPNDPMIPIIGLAHDIGKIECYEVTYEGIAIEKRSNHDWRGRFLLTCLPEFWKLAEIDRTTLLDVVGFYHHPWEIPTNVADRPRAMIELVLQADKEAGEYEAKHPRMATVEDVYDMVRRMLEARGESPEKASLPDRDLPYEVELSGVQLSLHQSRLLYFFEELMFQKDSINGGDTEKRIGIKIKDTMYFNEEAVRERLGKLLTAKKLIESTKNDGQKILTTRLMEVLSLRGCLINVVDGFEFGPGRSLFKLTARSVQEKKAREYVWPAVFMVDAKAYPDEHLEIIEDVDLEVVSITPIYGWQQAKNKASKKIKSEEGAPILLGVSVSTDVEDELQSAVNVTDIEEEPVHVSEVDHTDGVAKELYEGGEEDLAQGVENAIEAAMALPEKRVPSDKRKKREKRREDKDAINAASPINTMTWWEANEGRDLFEQLVSLVRDQSSNLKMNEVNGVVYGFAKLKSLMSALEIPLTGEEKVTSLLSLDKTFMVAKSKEGENFLGVSKSVLENP
jgi:hypothetical protein